MSLNLSDFVNHAAALPGLVFHANMAPPLPPWAIIFRPRGLARAVKVCQSSDRKENGTHVGWRVEAAIE